MFWLSKVVAPLALVAGTVGACAAIGAADDGAQPPPPPPGAGGFQPPFGKGFPGQPPFKGFERKGDKKDEPKRGEPKRDEPKRGERPQPKADPTVEAWLRVLLDKITDPHDTVRDSARGAVVGVGRPAVPALERLANGDDPAKAVAARKLLAEIERGPRGPMGGPPFGGPPMGPMFGGPRGPMGPMGPMFGGPPRGERGPMGQGPERKRDADAPEVAPFPAEVAAPRG